MCELRPLSRMPFEDDLRQPHNFGCNRVRPRVIEAEFRSSFFSGDFCWCFNGGAQWITQLAGVFPVGVVDAPQLLAGLQSRARFHGDSSPKTKRAKMYQLHKIRGQS